MRFQNKGYVDTIFVQSGSAGEQTRSIEGKGRAFHWKHGPFASVFPFVLKTPLFNSRSRNGDCWPAAWGRLECKQRSRCCERSASLLIEVICRAFGLADEALSDFGGGQSASSPPTPGAERRMLAV